MIARQGLVDAAREARAGISKIDGFYDAAPVPPPVPPDATPGQLLVLMQRSGSAGVEPFDVIKAARISTKEQIKAAKGHIDKLFAASDFFSGAEKFIQSSHVTLLSSPDGIPEDIATHIRCLKTYIAAGILDKQEVVNCLSRAAIVSFDLAVEAKQEFKRFEYTSSIALCRQAAIYCRKWSRDYAAAGYEKRADRLSKSYRLWVERPRSADAILAAKAFNETGVE